MIPLRKLFLAQFHCFSVVSKNALNSQKLDDKDKKHFFREAKPSNHLGKVFEDCEKCTYFIDIPPQILLSSLAFVLLVSSERVI